MRMTEFMIATALGTALAAAPAVAKTPQNTLVIASAIDDITSLDVEEAYEPGGILVVNQVYQPLVSYEVDKPQDIKGVLAKSWSVSDDGLTYTFKMNREAKFASGNPVTAKDAQYSLSRMIKLKSRAAFIITQFGFTPENVDEKIKAVDDDTLTITVSEAYSPSFLLYCLSTPVASVVDSVEVKKHEANGDFGNAWLKAGASAGSGPFMIKQWQAGQSVALDRNANFWGKAPGIEKIVFRHVKESAAQRLLLDKGDVDIANQLSPDDHEALAANGDVVKMTGVSGTIYYMGLNLRNEKLNNPKIREAMKYLVDYEGISKTISRGTTEVRQTMIPRGFLGFMDYKPYSYNVDKAKALIADSGVTGPVEISMTVWDAPPYKDFAAVIQANMAKGGITMKLDVVDGKQWLAKYRAHDLDIWLGLWGPDYPDPHTNTKQFTVMKKDSVDGVEALPERFGWDSGQLSKDVMAAVRERDNAKRQAMYETIQKAHTAQSPFIYMFQDVRAVGVRKDVQGLVLGANFGDDRYWAVSKK